MENVSAHGHWPYVLPSRRTQEELQDLNLRFIELIGTLAEAPAGALGLDRAITARISRLRPGRRREMASCPYALHGVSLQDRAFWEGVRQETLPQRPDRQLSNLAPRELAEIRGFLFVALAYGWHLAAINPLAARWMLGASAEELARLTSLPFGALRQVATECPGLLRARLSDRRRFWEDLVQATESGSRQARFAAISLGLQLSAAAGTLRPVSPG